ncbi:hypothetical protein BGZ54_008350 [Gamsiella multidivaricata]|nr:hypothetical protein BGZ54_008350 [Gamsiella multidivaricata]
MPKASKTPAKGFYAVHVGRTKGIYFSWAECEKQVKGVIGAKFKKFETQKDAEEFVRTGPKVYTKAAPKSSNAGASRPSPYAAAAAARAGATSASASGSGLSVTVSSTAGETSKDHYTRVNGVRVAASDTIVIYTDGSSLSNGKVGSQAGVGVFFGVNDPRNVSERLDSEPQTNQRAELMAVKRALEVCGSDTAPLEIRTDSMYTVHVRAHIGTFGNEMADRLANAGAILPKPSLL